jgi:PilZ domain
LTHGLRLIGLGCSGRAERFPCLRPLKILMSPVERRQLERFRTRIPLRFRTLGHFSEAINVSRGGFFFVTSAPLQVGMPIEATIRMPAEVTGTNPEETHCKARVVHAKPDSYSDGRMGFGAEIEGYIQAEKPKSFADVVKTPPAANLGTSKGR